jgi:hypothetical protein
MSHTEPKRLEIERLIARELDNEKIISLESHFKECTVCNEYYLSLCKERDTFLRVYPYSSITTMAKETEAVTWFKKLLDSLIRPALVPVYATLLIAAVFAPVVIRENTRFSSESINYKGNSKLSFAYQRDGLTKPGSGEYKLTKGDQVQVFYSSDHEQYVSLLSIDETGVVSFYHPDQSSESCSVLTGRGDGIAFEGSILFDNVSGNELVVAVFSESPLKTEEVKLWMAANYKSNSDLQSLSKKIEAKSFAKKTTIQTLLLKKG